MTAMPEQKDTKHIERRRLMCIPPTCPLALVAAFDIDALVAGPQHRVPPRGLPRLGSPIGPAWGRVHGGGCMGYIWGVHGVCMAGAWRVHAWACVYGRGGCKASATL